ncbi:MAG: EF-hand domain-containing protein [Rhodospirillales bacterium]
MKRAITLIRPLSTAILSGALLCSPAGLAQGQGVMGGGMMPPMHAVMDSDDSGTVSLPEFRDNREQMFELIDADSDGLISAAEFQDHEPMMGGGGPGGGANAAMRDQMLTHRMDLMDTNADGKLSRAEFMAGAEADFAAADADGNGELLPTEMRGMGWRR